MSRKISTIPFGNVSQNAFPPSNHVSSKWVAPSKQACLESVRSLYALRRDGKTTAPSPFRNRLPESPFTLNSLTRDEPFCSLRVRRQFEQETAKGPSHAAVLRPPSFSTPSDFRHELCSSC